MVGLRIQEKLNHRSFHPLKYSFSVLYIPKNYHLVVVSRAPVRLQFISMSVQICVIKEIFEEISKRCVVLGEMQAVKKLTCMTLSMSIEDRCDFKFSINRSSEAQTL